MPKEAFIYNLLRDTTATTASVIGVNGVEANSPGYGWMIWENGFIQSGYAGLDTIYFPYTYVGEGAVEFLLRPYWTSTSLPGAYPQLLNMPTGGFNLQPGSGNLTIFYRDASYVFSYVRLNWSFTANEAFSFGVSWNSAGFADGSYIKGYKNNVELTVNTSPTGTGLWSTPAGGNLYLLNRSAGGRGFRGGLSQFQCYDYAKTDFKDGLKQRANLNDSVMQM